MTAHQGLEGIGDFHRAAFDKTKRAPGALERVGGRIEAKPPAVNAFGPEMAARREAGYGKLASPVLTSGQGVASRIGSMSAPSPEFRTLIADPSTHMAGLVTLMLHSLKLRAVDEVGDAKHAAEFLARRPYDLMLIDDQLGAEENFALIRGIRTTLDHPN